MPRRTNIGANKASDEQSLTDVHKMLKSRLSEQQYNNAKQRYISSRKALAQAGLHMPDSNEDFFKTMFIQCLRQEITYDIEGLFNDWYQR